MLKICNDYLEKISLLTDNMLDDAEKNQTLDHLKHCEACNKYYNDLIKIKASLSSVSYDIPMDISKTVVQRIKKNDKKKKTIKKLSLYIPSVAAACLVLVFSLIFFNNNNIGQKADDNYRLSADGAQPEQAPEEIDFYIKGIYPTATSINNFTRSDYVIKDNEYSPDEFLSLLNEDFPEVSARVTENTIIFEVSTDVLIEIIDKYGLVAVNTYETGVIDENEKVTNKIIFD